MCATIALPVALFSDPRLEYYRRRSRQWQRITLLCWLFQTCARDGRLTMRDEAIAPCLSMSLTRWLAFCDQLQQDDILILDPDGEDGLRLADWLTPDAPNSEAFPGSAPSARPPRPADATWNERRRRQRHDDAGGNATTTPPDAIPDAAPTLPDSGTVLDSGTGPVGDIYISPEPDSGTVPVPGRNPVPVSVVERLVALGMIREKAIAREAEFTSLRCRQVLFYLDARLKDGPPVSDPCRFVVDYLVKQHPLPEKTLAAFQQAEQQRSAPRAVVRTAHPSPERTEPTGVKPPHAWFAAHKSKRASHEAGSDP